MGIRVEWWRDINDIAALEQPWRELEARVARHTPFVSCDFLIPWYRHYRGRFGTPVLGAAWDGEDLIGLAPLVEHADRLGGIPVRRVAFAGYDGESGEFLLSQQRPELIGALLESLLSHGRFNLMCLTMDSGSPALGALEAEARSRGLGVERTRSAYAVVDIAQGYEAYSRASDHRLRKDLKKRANKIAKAGGCALSGARLGADGAAFDQSLQRMFAISNRSWKARQGGPMAASHREFFAEVTRRFAGRGAADLSILEIGGRDAAYLMGLAEQGTYYDVTVSFADEFAGFAPGFHLMQELLRVLPALGIHTVISHGDHEYKRRWASRFQEVARVFLLRGHLRSRLARLIKFRLAPRLEKGLKAKRDAH